MQKKPEIKDTIVENISVDWRYVHLALSLIDREVVLEEDKLDWYPKQHDAQYYAMLQNAGQTFALVIPPDGVDKFLEQFPHLYRYFNCTLDEARAHARKLLKLHLESFPNENDPILQEEMEKTQLFDPEKHFDEEAERA